MTYLVRENATGTVRRCELTATGFQDVNSNWTCSPDDVPSIAFGQDHPDSPLWFDDGPGDPICEGEYPEKPR